MYYDLNEKKSQIKSAFVELTFVLIAIFVEVMYKKEMTQPKKVSKITLRKVQSVRFPFSSRVGVISDCPKIRINNGLMTSF